MTLSSDDVVPGAAGGSAAPRTERAPLWRGLRWVLLTIGFTAAFSALALLIGPVSDTSVGGPFPERADCGVPLKALFRLPGEPCYHVALGRAHAALFLAGVAVVMFALAGVKPRLRFLGLVLLAGASFVMLTNTSDWIVRYYPRHCGSGMGDLARLGGENTDDIGNALFDTQCGGLALRRLGVAVTIAALGVALIVIAEIRRRRRGNGRPIRRRMSRLALPRRSTT